MKDDLTRRDFLRSAGLGLAGVVGASVLSRSAAAQQEQPGQDEKKKDEEKKDENDDLLQNGDSGEEEETRACPQCGALMYRQGHTWSCENCGYSYVE